MRDAVILVIMVAGALATLRQPWIGTMMWTWISIMNPHVEFGYAAGDWPVGMLIAVCTLIGFVGTQHRHNPMVGAPTWWLLLFTIWICITLPFSIYLEPSIPLWDRSMRIFFFMFVTLALLETRKQVDVFIWVMVISLGFYGVKGGIFTLGTGGNYRVWGPGGFIEGNNEVALALIMTIPLMKYLQLQMTSKWHRMAMTAAMLLTGITVLGTHSRGALLGIAAMLMVLWAKGKNKIGNGFLFVAVAMVVLPFMPEHWWSRMETIKTYEEDGSALGRINAWWNAYNLAKDRIFGGGFMIYRPEVFQKYSPEPERVHAAHSIYFQVLGEHGFIGLFLFLGVFISTWMVCRRLIKNCRGVPEDRWAADLGAMIQVSLVGYAVGGAFLSLAYFDLPFNMMVAAVIASYVVRKRTEVPPLAAPGQLR